MRISLVNATCVLILGTFFSFGPAAWAAPPFQPPSLTLPEPNPVSADTQPSARAGAAPARPEEVLGRATGQLAPGAGGGLLSAEFTPIDLDSAFRLAGVENPQIRIAVQQLAESVAARQLAAAQILPSLNAGTNYNNHTGVLQQVDGSMLTVNRSSLYAGAGAFVVGAGTVQIPGVMWNLNISQATFNYLQSRQLVAQRRFNTAAMRNEMLLQVAVAYLELLRAEELRAITTVIRDDAREVARITGNFAKTGQGRKADAHRAATELRQRETDLLQLEADVLTTAARLAALLNLSPAVRLHPADNWAIPKAIVSDEILLPQLIATAVMGRPELAARQAAIRQALLALNSAKLLPFSPNVMLGFSAGTFGGGSNLVTPVFGDFGSRSDLDAVAYWTLQNVGIGNRALINGAAARYRASDFEQIAVLNRVRSEVASAHARSQARFAQIAINEEAVQAAEEAFRQDLARTRAKEGLPIEVLNSLRLLARARAEYLSSIVDFNRAQFELYVSLGQPPAASLARPVDASRPAPDRGNPPPARP